EVPGNFVKILPVFDGNANSAILGVTKDRRLYIVSAYTAGQWRQLPIPSTMVWDTYYDISSTGVQGNIVIQIDGVGLCGLDVAGSVLTDLNPTVTGLDMTKIKGVC